MALIGYAGCHVETQHAAGLSRLTPAKSASSENSAAPLAARLRIARRCNPRTVVRKSSPASSRTAELPFASEIKSSRPANAGRLNCLFPSEIKSRRPANDAGLQHEMRQPGISPGYSQPRRKKCGTSLGKTNLDKHAGCCVATCAALLVSQSHRRIHSHSAMCRNIAR